MGEDQWRIKQVGSPGIDGIQADALPFSDLENELTNTVRPRQYALVLVHPTSPNEAAEFARMSTITNALRIIPFKMLIFIYPNNDPGFRGIIRCFSDQRILDNTYAAAFHKDMPRNRFLSYLKHAAVLIGNSSSGIIEAASFGTPVINIGDRQKGRERNQNVIDVPANAAAIRRALNRVWNNGRPIHFPRKNIYGSGRTSEKIAHILATIPLDERLRRKLITY